MCCKPGYWHFENEVLFSAKLVKWKPEANGSHLCHHLGKACLRMKPAQRKSELRNGQGQFPENIMWAPESSHAWSLYPGLFDYVHYWFLPLLKPVWITTHWTPFRTLKTICITWELFRNVESQAHPRPTISILTRNFIWEQALRKEQTHLHWSSLRRVY